MPRRLHALRCPGDEAPLLLLKELDNFDAGVTEPEEGISGKCSGLCSSTGCEVDDTLRLRVSEETPPASSGSAKTRGEI